MPLSPSCIIYEESQHNSPFHNLQKGVLSIAGESASVRSSTTHCSTSITYRNHSARRTSTIRIPRLRSPSEADFARVVPLHIVSASHSAIVFLAGVRENLGENYVRGAPNNSWIGNISRDEVI